MAEIIDFKQNTPKAEKALTTFAEKQDGFKKLIEIYNGLNETQKEKFKEIANSGNLPLDLIYELSDKFTHFIASNPDKLIDFENTLKLESPAINEKIVPKFPFEDPDGDLPHYEGDVTLL